MQLRRQLFWCLGLMTMVPLVVLLFVVAERVETELEDRVGSELHETLRKLSRELDTLMDTHKALALGLAGVPSVRNFATVASTAAPDRRTYEVAADQLAAFFLSYQATIPSLQALRFVDPQGKTLVKVKEGHLVKARYRDGQGRSFVEDISHKPFFLITRAEDEKVSVSDFERGRVTGEVDFCPAMVRYAVPIKDEIDTPQGMLIVNMWGKRIDEAVEAALAGYPGKAYIVEAGDDAVRDGIYLYHPDPKWRFANQLGSGHRFSRDVGDAVWRSVKQTPEQGTATLPDGRMLFYRAYEPYSDGRSRWLLVIETTRAAILAPIASLRQSIWLLMGAVLIGSLIIARWAAARLARPVHELAQIITRYADGERTVRYQGSGGGEIGYAGRAFNYLSTRLEQAEREREQAEQAARQSERLAALGQLAAGIGHEINNPLMNIMSLTSLVEHSLPGGVDPQVRDDLRMLQDEGRRCARIVQGILNFARENQPHYRVFDMAELIQDTAALMKHRFQAAGVGLALEVHKPLSLEGDLDQLQQVLVNVVLNAIHASPPDSLITVRAGFEGERVRIEVVDRGSGIDDASLAKVFDPFFTTKSEGQGTGLGLSVSYGIVKRHGGSIVLERAEPRGVRVVISLPTCAQPRVGQRDAAPWPRVSHAE